ncbi:MAG: WXG100 family type VII secretion target [Eubacterium sp.]|nr:WXG100 family type VII secretion target [Eubacterium sp.]
MSQIRVTASQLRAQAEALRTTNNNFKARVGNLESTEAQLKSMWEGEANDAFHAAFTRDKIQMDNFYNAIMQYATVLDNIATKYENAEATNTNTATTRTY